VKADRNGDWKPKIRFKKSVKIVTDADLQFAKRES